MILVHRASGLITQVLYKLTRLVTQTRHATTRRVGHKRQNGQAMGLCEKYVQLTGKDTARDDYCCCLLCPSIRSEPASREGVVVA